MFSGIGGFERGILQADPTVEFVFASENDKFARQIYRKQFGVEPSGDITKINAADVPGHDILVCGPPCQDYSIAGKREGLQGARGSMFFELFRILREKQPKLVLIENVKGILSSAGGWDFAKILIELEIAGYWVEWQILDTAAFLPHHRERVFIIGHRKDTEHLNIFPLDNTYNYMGKNNGNEKMYVLSQDVTKECKSFLFQLSQKKCKNIPRGQMQSLLKKIQQGIQKKTCREVQRNTAEMDTNTEGSIQVTKKLNTWPSCENIPRDVYKMVQFPTKNMLLLWIESKSASISCGCIQQQDISIKCGSHRSIERLRRGELGFMLFALQSYKGRFFFSIGDGRDWQNIYIKKMDKIFRPELRSLLEENTPDKYYLSDKAIKWLIKNSPESIISISDKLGDEKQSAVYTIDANYYKGVAHQSRTVILCDSSPGRSNQIRDELVAPIRANTGAGHNNIVVEVPEIAKCLTGGGHSGGNHSDMTIVNTDSRIRRLTPTEVEKLQGFPVDWTAEGINDRGDIVQISDTRRYKTLGNAVSVPVIEFIYKHIMEKIE